MVIKVIFTSVCFVKRSTVLCLRFATFAAHVACAFAFSRSRVPRGLAPNGLGQLVVAKGNAA